MVNNRISRIICPFKTKKEAVENGSFFANVIGLFHLFMGQPTWNQLLMFFESTLGVHLWHTRSRVSLNLAIL